ncbi:MAG: phosphatase PAP2 family protein, partial [Chloroflexi bacterium]|nr:phosphatase PAP2 family protein [Chloroflexota bacterium]
VSDFFVPVMGSLVLFGLWLHGRGPERFRNQLVTIAGASSVGVANAVTALINARFFRPRPFLDNELTLLFYEPTDSSFPSNAAAVGFALATAVFVRHRRTGAALYALAVLWGLARVYAGVHYPTDVIAGAAVGIAAGIAMTLLWRWLIALPRAVLRVMARFYLA